MTSTALTLSSFAQKTQSISAVATQTLTVAARSLSRTVDVEAIRGAVRSTQAMIVQPTAAALNRVKEDAQVVVVSMLPEQWADENARNSVRTGAQWGAKVGGWFGPIGTAVGVSVGVATAVGLRYLTYDSQHQVLRPTPVVDGEPVLPQGAEMPVVAKPKLRRVATM